MKNICKSRSLRYAFWLTFSPLAVLAVVFHYDEPVYLLFEIMLDFYFFVGCLIVFMGGMIILSGLSLYFRRRSDNQSEGAQSETAQPKRNKLQSFRMVVCRSFYGFLTAQVLWCGLMIGFEKDHLLTASILFLGTPNGRYENLTQPPYVFLALGANVNHRMKFQKGWYTPLYLAVYSGRTELVKRLLKEGADPDFPAKIFLYGEKEILITPLFKAEIGPFWGYKSDYSDADPEILALLKQASAKKNTVAQP